MGYENSDKQASRFTAQFIQMNNIEKSQTILFLDMVQAIP